MLLALAIMVAVPSLVGARVATGTYIGSEVSGRMISGLGFRPDIVILKCDEDYPTILATSTMPAGQSKYMSWNTSLQGSNITSLDVDGFTVSSSDYVNKADKRFDWVALSAEAGVLEVGTYVGNGADNVTIVVGWAPDYAVVIPSHTAQSLQKSENMANDVCLPFDNEGPLNNHIQRLAPSGFTIGNDAAVNQIGVVYHYIVWKSTPGRFAVGSYLGNGSDNRLISGLGFKPSWVGAKSLSAEDGTHLPRSLDGTGESLYFDHKKNDANRIQSLESDGFVVGSDKDINQSGVMAFWAAIGSSSDLTVVKTVDRDTAFVGDTVIFEVTLSNAGPDRALNIQIRDLLPAGLGFVSASPGSGTYSPITGIWKPEAIEVGDTHTLGMTAIVLAGSAGQTLSNQASVFVFEDYDPNIVDNTDTASIVVLRQADLEISGFVDDATPVAGDIITLTIEAQNLGPDAATGVRVDAALPVGLIYESHIASLGSYDPVSGAWTISTMASLDLGSLQIQAQVAVEATGQFLSMPIEIESDIIDPEPVNNSSAIMIRVLGADLALSMSANTLLPVPGEFVTFDVGLTNDGPDTADDVVVTDLLPAGFAYVSSNVTQGTYNSVSGSWDVGTLIISGSPTMALVGRVTATEAGLLTNVATVSNSSLPDQNPANNTAQVTVDVQGMDIALGLTVDDAFPNVGDEVTFTVTTENVGFLGATNLVVSAAPAPGLTWASAVPSQGTYDQVTGLWTIGSLSSGASCVLLLSSTVDPGTGGTVVVDSVLVASVDQQDLNSTNDIAFVSLDIQAANLRLIKNVDDPTPLQGSNVVFTVLVTNNGPDPAEGVAVADTLPGGLVFQSSLADRGTYDVVSGIWDLGPVAVGETVALDVIAEVQLDVGGGDTAVNTASIFQAGQEDPDSSDNTDSAVLTQQSADVHLEGSIDNTTPAAGDLVRITLTVRNDGPGDVSSLVVRDTIPNGLSYTGHDPAGAAFDPLTGLWAIGALMVGESDTLMVDVAVDAGSSGDTIPVVARVQASDQADPDGSNNLFTSQVVVREAEIDLSWSTADPAPTVGDTVFADLTLANVGPDVLESALVSITLSSGLVLLSAVPDQGSWNGATGEWTPGSVAASGFVTLAVGLRVDGTVGTMQTIEGVVADARPGDSDPQAMPVSQVFDIRGADLFVQKSVNVADADEGETVLYTVTVRNNGPDVVTGVVVRDTLESRLAFVGYSPAWAAYDPVDGVWDVGTLQVGGTASLFLQARIIGSTPGDVVVNEAAVDASDLADPDLSNDISQALVTVAAADLRLQMSAGDGEPSMDDLVVITLSVSNDGPDRATGVVVSMPVPTGFEFTHSDAPTFDPVAGRWIVGELLAATSAEINMTLRIADGTAGDTLQVVAAVAEVDQGDPTPANDIASVELIVRPDADLGVGVTASSASVDVGDTVLWTIRIRNHGPSDATGVAVSDTLPNSMLLSTWNALQGAYDAGTHRWDISAIAAGDSAELQLQTLVLPGNGGSDPVVAAALIERDVADRNILNDHATRSTHINGADLSLESFVDVTLPEEGSEVNFTLSITNRGPDPATGVALLDSLPVGLEYIAHTPPAESFAVTPGGIGVWNVDTVEGQTPRVLFVRMRVKAGTTGQVMRHVVEVLAGDQEDPEPDNNVAVNSLTIAGTDLALVMTTDDAGPAEGDLVTTHLTVTNLGPRPGTRIAVYDSLCSGLQYIAADPAGVFDSGSGVWNIGALAPDDSVTLTLTLKVRDLTGGRTLTSLARILDMDQVDPVAQNDTSIVTFDIPMPGQGRMQVANLTLENGQIRPLSDPFGVLALRIANLSVRSDTLMSLTVTNAVEGDGIPGELDAVWSRLELWSLAQDQWQPIALTTEGMTSGVATFADLDMVFGPAGSLELEIRGVLSETARDGDRLRLLVADPGALTFRGDVVVEGAWPVLTEANLVVDGFVAAQTTLWPIAAGVMAPGELDRLVLDVAVPSDGYAEDVLQSLKITNRGTARAALDIARMRIWMDDGDGLSNPALDTLLGETVWTGSGWVLSGLDLTVPVGGIRLLVTVDTFPSAEGQRTIQLSLPILGIEMQSGNDGPVDVQLVNDFTQVISDSDRLYFSAASLPWRSVSADGADHLVFHLIATNTYSSNVTVNSLRLTNASRSPGTIDEDVLDAIVAQVVLRDDAQNDGVPGPDDIILGASNVSDGAAVLGGLSWVVPPASTRHLFVGARLAADLVADGDSIALILASAVDVQLAAGAELAGTWPLSGNGGAIADRTLASRFTSYPHGSFTLPPGSQKHLSYDVHIPANGHQEDVLQSLTLVNAGQADVQDVGEVGLWRDGGDGIFDAVDSPVSDDLLLGHFSRESDRWEIEGLDEIIPITGARLFVGVDIPESANDSSTVSLMIPVGGVEYASGADGPLDQAVLSGTSVMVNRSPLQTSLVSDPTATVIGRDVVFRFGVSNSGAAVISDVTPGMMEFTGEGILSLLNGPDPATADLEPGASTVFAWTYRAEGTGTVVPSVDVSGVAGGAAEVTSPRISAPPVLISAPAPELFMTAVSQLPFAVNVGQADVNAWTFQIRHPGQSVESSVDLTALAFRLEDDLMAPVPAGGVIGKVLIRADGELILAQIVESNAGSEMTFVPSMPLGINPDETRVLTVAIELHQDAAGSVFRLVLDQGGLHVFDRVTSDAVNVLLVDGEYPVRSQLTQVVEGASALAVTGSTSVVGRASRGMSSVPLGRIALTNPGQPGLGAGIQLGGIALELIDGDGLPLADPSAVASALKVMRGSVVLSRLESLPSVSGLLALSFDSPLPIPAGEEIELVVVMDLWSTAPLGLVAGIFTDGESWDARDANSGVPVSTGLDPDPLAMPGLIVLEKADLAHMSGQALGSEELTGGAHLQAVLALEIRHPGGTETAPVRIDSVTVHCYDLAGDPLAANTVLDRVTVLMDGLAVGSTPTSSAPDGLIRIQLSDLMLDPGMTGQIDIAVDVRSESAIDNFSLSIDLDDVRVSDLYLYEQVLLTADSGAVLPISSGPRSIKTAADELIVSAVDLMPAAITALGTSVPAMELALTNTAIGSEGDLYVTSVELTGRDTAKGLALGSFVGVFVALHDGEIWGQSQPLQPDDDTVVITGDLGLTIAPGETEMLEVRFEVAAGLLEGSLIVGFDLDGIGVQQPEGDLVTVRVLSAPGESFPFWTRTGNVSPASLSESYSNFPNPFAAGREITTFVFALSGPSSVELRLFTPRGELVRVLLDSDDRGLGLHQDVTWDGRNGRGDVVRNGVYIAEIVVHETAGGVQTLHRKVAVVR